MSQFEKIPHPWTQEVYSLPVDDATQMPPMYLFDGEGYVTGDIAFCRTLEAAPSSGTLYAIEESNNRPLKLTLVASGLFIRQVVDDIAWAHGFIGIEEVAEEDESLRADNTESRVRIGFAYVHAEEGLQIFVVDNRSELSHPWQRIIAGPGDDAETLPIDSCYDTLTEVAYRALVTRTWKEYAADKTPNILTPELN